jgi:hypothetical protein
LCDQSLVAVILSGDQLSQEIFPVGFCDSFGLVIENIGEVIMVFLES